MSEEERDEVRHELEQRLAQASRRTRIRLRLGRRGAFLVVMGFLFGTLGYVYGFNDLPTSAEEQLEMPILIGDLLTPGSVPTMFIWGVLWILAGLVAMVTAWWPPGRDHWGFIALWAFSATWSVLNFAGAVFLDAPRAEVIGIIFAIFAATVLIVSGMADPPAITTLEDEDNAQ